MQLVGLILIALFTVRPIALFTVELKAQVANVQINIRTSSSVTIVTAHTKKTAVV